MESEIQETPQLLKPTASINDIRLNQIAINNIPAPEGDIDHTSIERILHHIKDNFSEGNHSLDEYFINGGDDLFRICITYTFSYNHKTHTLGIELCSGFAEILKKSNVYELYRQSNNSELTVKKIRKKLNKIAARKLSNNDFLIATRSMSNEEKCQALFYCTTYSVTCLNRYLEFVFTDARLNHTTPNYYQFGVGTDADKFL